MSRDYSSYGKQNKRSKPRGQTTRRKKPAAKKSNGGMFWFVSGLAVGSLATAMILVPSMRPDLPVATPGSAPVEQYQPEFEFHNLLRDDEVVVQQAPAVVESPKAQTLPAPRPSVDTKPAPTPAGRAQPVASGDVFLVQAGSFSRKGDAENRRVQLMLMNFTNAAIESGKTSGGQQLYRVIVGPFGDQNTMTTALNRISSQGIETLPLKRKR